MAVEHTGKTSHERNLNSRTTCNNYTSTRRLAELPEWVSNPDPSLYWSDNYVVLDFETTTTLKGSPLVPENRIVLAVWYENSTGVLKSHFGSEYNQGELVADVNNAEFVIAHNAKFELGWLKRCGVDLRRIITFDTMIAEHVLGGNRYALQQLGLQKCLERRGMPGKKDTVARMIKHGIPVENIPEDWLLKYCVGDVEAAHALFLAQRQELQDQELASINYQRNLVTPALTDIEFNGMQLDAPEVLKLEEETEQEYNKLSTELQKFCRGASPASPKQMREFIYDTLGFQIPRDYRKQPMLTPSGDPSTASPVLKMLVGRTVKQKEFLTLRGKWAVAHSNLTKYVRKFADCVKDSGGLLNSSFNQTSTRTHRLSASGAQHRVQFQNLNRNFKPLFKPRNDGWSMGEADGSQLEFRVAVHLGRDKVGLQSIVGGEDIHAYTATIIGCSRQDAKPHTFKPLYGGMSGTPEQRRYYEAFKAKYKGISDTQYRWTQQVLRDKELTTEWGMKYYWPDTVMKKSGYITNSTSIFNYPVQALATAELIPIALVCAWHRMKNLSSFIVNTVHDSVIAEVHPNELDLWRLVSKQVFIEDTYNLISRLYGVALTVPLAVEIVEGPRWGKKETEVTFEAEPELWKEAAKKEGML